MFIGAYAVRGDQCARVREAPMGVTCLQIIGEREAAFSRGAEQVLIGSGSRNVDEWPSI